VAAASLKQGAEMAMNDAAPVNFSRTETGPRKIGSTRPAEIWSASHSVKRKQRLLQRGGR
jgi:hypothetical protein